MNRRSRAIVHLSLGLGMLGVVVAAGLSPNTGAVPASSNCTYGQCPSSSSPFPLWAVGASIAAVVVALLLAFLILRRRRRPGQPPSQWEGPEGPGGPPPGAGGPEGPGSYEVAGAGVAAGGLAAGTAEPEWQESPATTEEPGSGAESSYVEPPPAPPPTPATAPPPAPVGTREATPAESTAATAGAAAPSAEEAEPDIDSLMAELEKISGEILKQKPKRKNGSTAPADDDSS